MHKIGDDTPTANGAGEFQETPTNTDLRSDFMNTIQRELVAVVEGFGLVLDPGDDAQILKALTGVPQCLIYHDDVAARLNVTGNLIFNTIAKENTTYSIYNTTNGEIQPQEAGWYEIEISLDVLVPATSVEYIFGTFNSAASAPLFKLRFINENASALAISGHAKWFVYFNGSTDVAELKGGTAMDICTDFGSERAPWISIRKLII